MNFSGYFNVLLTYCHHRGVMQIWNTIHKDPMYNLASLYLVLSVNFADLILTIIYVGKCVWFPNNSLWIDCFVFCCFSLFWQNGTKLSHLSINCWYVAPSVPNILMCTTYKQGYLPTWPQYYPKKIRKLTLIHLILWPHSSFANCPSIVLVAVGSGLISCFVVVISLFFNLEQSLSLFLTLITLILLEIASHFFSRRKDVWCFIKFR